MDITVGSGVPRSMRTEANSFLYDESILAGCFVKSLTHQIALSFFSDLKLKYLTGREEVRTQAMKLLGERFFEDIQIGNGGHDITR